MNKINLRNNKKALILSFFKTDNYLFISFSMYLSCISLT